MIRTVATIFLAVAALLPAAQVSDPLSFASDVYRHFLQSTDYIPPQDIYTPRLHKLIQDDRKQSKGEVGCLDFEFWINGQDWQLSNLSVKSGEASPDRQTVVAKFSNMGTPEEIHLDFVRNGKRWLLDDVHSLTEPRWTLSEMLKCAR